MGVAEIPLRHLLPEHQTGDRQDNNPVSGWVGEWGGGKVWALMRRPNMPSRTCMNACICARRTQAVQHAQHPHRCIAAPAKKNAVTAASPAQCRYACASTA